MFGMLGMIGNYEQRKVARFERGELMVDTCMVTDSREPYETAVEHPKFNKGKIVIVEMYDSKSQARIGHKKWVKIMTAKKLPKKLEDVSTSEIKELINALS